MKAQIARVSVFDLRGDVNAIANHFGGGGHIRAAGCTIEGSIDEAKSRLLEVIK